MLDVTYLQDEINYTQPVPEVEQPLANFERTLTPNAESASVPTPTTIQSAPTLSVVSDFYI